MPALNCVHLIGNLTADPELVTFQSGAKVCKMRMAVNNRKRNQQTGGWENDPVFLDLSAWNRGDSGTLATRMAETLGKGRLIFVRGQLRQDAWKDKETGQQRSKLYVVVDDFQYLDPRPGDASDQDQAPARGQAQRAPAPQTRSAPARGQAPQGRPAPRTARPDGPDPAGFGDSYEPDQSNGPISEEDIPF